VIVRSSLRKMLVLDSGLPCNLRGEKPGLEGRAKIRRAEHQSGGGVLCTLERYVWYTVMRS
jgi:hypothetical protein